MQSWSETCWSYRPELFCSTQSHAGVSVCAHGLCTRHLHGCWDCSKTGAWYLKGIRRCFKSLYWLHLRFVCKSKALGSPGSPHPSELSGGVVPIPGSKTGYAGNCVQPITGHGEYLISSCQKSLHSSLCNYFLEEILSCQLPQAFCCSSCWYHRTWLMVAVAQMPLVEV